MEIKDIERGLFQLSRMSIKDANAHFPNLSAQLAGFSMQFVDPPGHARRMFNILRTLREEIIAPELVDEMKRLLEREPVSK